MEWRMAAKLKLLQGGGGVRHQEDGALWEKREREFKNLEGGLRRGWWLREIVEESRCRPLGVAECSS